MQKITKYLSCDLMKINHCPILVKFRFTVESKFDQVLIKCTIDNKKLIALIKVTFIREHLPKEQVIFTS